MKCPNCGVQNSPGTRYCFSCGTSLVRDYNPVRPPKKSSALKIVILVVVILVLVLVVAPAVMYLFFTSSFGPGSAFSDSLELSYDYGNSTEFPSITISGNITNLGEQPFYATIEISIVDSRGWTMNSTVAVGTVAGGTSVWVNRNYGWPTQHDGKGLSTDTGGPVVPTWTHHIFTQEV